MAKRRRQDSSRASLLAMKAEKSIGFILVRMPPGERKSGMPHSVEMPAPVNGTITSQTSISSRRRDTAVVTSGAIMVCPAPGNSRSFRTGRGNKEVAHEISAHHAARAQSRRGAPLLCGPARHEVGAPPGGREEQ